MTILVIVIFGYSKIFTSNAALNLKAKQKVRLYLSNAYDIERILRVWWQRHLLGYSLTFIFKPVTVFKIIGFKCMHRLSLGLLLLFLF